MLFRLPGDPSLGAGRAEDSSACGSSAGAFLPAGWGVCVPEKDGILRGCIGTYLPTEENLAEEIIENAIRSATEDPRFPPDRPEELPEHSITVDVLSPPEPCGEEDLDPNATV